MYNISFLIYLLIIYGTGIFVMHLKNVLSSLLQCMGLKKVG